METKDQNVWWTSIYVSRDVYEAYDALKIAGLHVEVVAWRELRVHSDEIGIAMKILARLRM